MGIDSEDGTTRNRKRSWWEKRTRMERCGVVLLAISVVLITALIAALAVIVHKEKVRPEDEICNTPDCVETAARILKNIDQSVDPCNDFYEFACGNFLREAVISDDQPSVSPLTELNDVLENQLRTIFEETPFADEAKPFTFVRKFYNACLDTESLEDPTELKQLLENLGGWPVLEGDAWNEQNFNWKESVYKFGMNGLSTDNFIKIGLQPDMRNSSQFILFLDEADLEIGRLHLLNGLDDEIIKAYSDYMVELAASFGVDRAFAENDVKNMMEFKMQLANISLPESERRDQSTLYHLMTIRELQRRYPTIYWLEYINNIIDLPDQLVTNDDKVNVAAPEYLSKIGYLLDRTSKRAQANHAIFQALRFMEWYLPKNVRDLEQRFKEFVFGITSSPPRWKECVRKVTAGISIATGALYVRKYFSEDTKKSAVEMISDIKDAFITVLEETKWMDNSTREKAIEKALAMKSHIAYPEEYLDDNKLKDYYSELDGDCENMIKCVANVSVFQTKTDFKWLGKFIDKTDWRNRYPTAEVNAVYAVQENSIELPAAILQGVVFGKNRLRSMNYGNMGFFIGHEITHGFDDQGRKFDKEGNLIDWWAEETSKAFMKKAECIVKQYSNYTIPELGVNLDGTLTQGENIADNGGVKEAYMAYNAWVERNGLEPKLPGLNYTAKQLFWISAANCWCEKERMDSLQISIFDVHSPGRFRVLGSFSNSEYFAKDFQCPVGSKMNPKHKCPVW